MGQFKKEAVRQAILDGAAGLFKEMGYSNTTVPAIAKRAGVSPANIYVYFPSKLRIFFAVYDPWFREQFGKLETSLAAVEGAEERLRHILRAIWVDIPMRDGGFPNNLMQVMSTGSVEEGYERDLLMWSEVKIAELIAQSLPGAGLNAEDLSYLCRLIFMAHDGFTMNLHIRGASPRTEGVIDLTVSLIVNYVGLKQPVSKDAALI